MQNNAETSKGNGQHCHCECNATRTSCQPSDLYAYAAFVPDLALSESCSDWPMQRYQFYIPFKYDIPAGAHLFFVPQVGLNCKMDTPAAEDACNFMWASAPYPVTPANGVSPPFAPRCCVMLQRFLLAGGGMRA